MMLLFSRLVFSAIVLVLAYLALAKIWTQKVDVAQLFKKPLAAIPVAESFRTFSINSTWTGNAGEPARMWLVRDNERTPIFASIMVHFTNLKTVPVMFLSYWIEQQTTDGTWQKVGIPFGMDGKTYNGPDLKDVSEFEFVTFDSVVQNRNIGPNETVSGDIFVIRPMLGKLRFTFKDTLGNMSSEPINPIATEGWPTQGPMIKGMRKHVDISAVPLSGY